MPKEQPEPGLKAKLEFLDKYEALCREYGLKVTALDEVHFCRGQRAHAAGRARVTEQLGQLRDQAWRDSRTDGTAFQGDKQGGNTEEKA